MLVTIIDTLPITNTGSRLRRWGTRALPTDLDSRITSSQVTGSRVSGSQVPAVQAIGARAMGVRALRAHAWADGLQPGADGTCAARSGLTRGRNTTSRDPGRITAPTPAALP